MGDCYIVGALRTPIGNFGKGLASIPAPELGGLLIREFIKQEACAPDQVDQVVFGNVLQAGLGMNPARQAAVRGGLPYDVPAYTVNMVCASGLYSIILADRAIRHREAHAVIAGGFENMSRAPRATTQVTLGKSTWPRASSGLDAYGWIMGCVLRLSYGQYRGKPCAAIRNPQGGTRRVRPGKS